MSQTIPEISPEELFEKMDLIKNGKILLVDVRREDEFSGELGHIAGAQLVTLGPSLLEYLDKADPKANYVFVCRSGGRSGNATQASQLMGFNHCLNMTGGMLKWNELGLPIQKG